MNRTFRSQKVCPCDEYEGERETSSWHLWSIDHKSVDCDAELHKFVTTALVFEISAFKLSVACRSSVLLYTNIFGRL